MSNKNLYQLYKDSIPSLNENKLVEFMSKTWTYRNINLFQVVLEQIKGNNKDFAEALQELYYAFNNGRDIGVEGFVWKADAKEFFEKNKEAIIEWLEEFADNFPDEVNVGGVVQNLDKDNDAIFDLLCDNGETTKAVIARQLMYEIAIDLYETSIDDYIEAGVINKLEELC